MQVFSGEFLLNDRISRGEPLRKRYRGSLKNPFAEFVFAAIVIECLYVSAHKLFVAQS